MTNELFEKLDYFSSAAVCISRNRSRQRHVDGTAQGYFHGKLKQERIMRSLVGLGGVAAILGVSAWHMVKRHRQMPMPREMFGFRYPGRGSSTSHVAMWRADDSTSSPNVDVSALPLVETKDLTEPLCSLLGKTHGVGFTIDAKSGLGPAVFLALKHCRNDYSSPTFGRTTLYTRVKYHDKHKDVKEWDIADLLHLPVVKDPPGRPNAAVFMVTTRPPAEVMSDDMASAVQDATSGLAVFPAMPCLEVPASAACDADAVQLLVDTLCHWLWDVVHSMGGPEEIVLVLSCLEIPELASAFGLALGNVSCNFRQHLRKLTVVTPTDTTTFILFKRP
jgi:hypothetical protein